MKARRFWKSVLCFQKLQYSWTSFKITRGISLVKHIMARNIWKIAKIPFSDHYLFILQRKMANQSNFYYQFLPLFFLSVSLFYGSFSGLLVVIFRAGSLRKQPTSREVATWALAKRRLSNKCRNSILMTRHYPDLGSASVENTSKDQIEVNGLIFNDVLADKTGLHSNWRSP